MSSMFSGRSSRRCLRFVQALTIFSLKFSDAATGELQLVRSSAHKHKSRTILAAAQDKAATQHKAVSTVRRVHKDVHQAFAEITAFAEIRKTATEAADVGNAADAAEAEAKGESAGESSDSDAPSDEAVGEAADAAEADAEGEGEAAGESADSDVPSPAADPVVEEADADEADAEGGGEASGESAVPDVPSAENAIDGGPTHCCYRIGGSAKKLEACCLEIATDVTDKDDCFAKFAKVDAWVGFTPTACPKDAKEAEQWIKVNEDAEEEELGYSPKYVVEEQS